MESNREINNSEEHSLNATTNVVFNSGDDSVKNRSVKPQPAVSFWKIFGATMAAVGVCMVIGFIILIIMGISFLSMFNLNMPKDEVKPQSVLCIDFAENIVDAPRVSMFGELDVATLSFSEPLTMLHALSAIESAATDDNIKGICINVNGMGSVSAANIEELRSAVERFKASGKFVVAYDDSYTQSEYYLASVADHIILHPEGSLEWRGVGFSSLYLKGLLDKIDAKVEVIRPTDCKYKSAVETFTNTSMSDADREQMEALANSMWDAIVADVALSRDLDAELLKQKAANLEINSAEDALAAGLIDEIGYKDNLIDYFTKHGVESNEVNGTNLISLGRYSFIIHADWQRVPFMEGSDIYKTPEDKPLVAVVYAEGEIVDGNMLMDDYVYGDMLAAQLRFLRNDENTKAVVLRINSPGGSALASDVIWREMKLLQETKPLVVSMGGYAASGGYYISVPADFIFADKLTLTGSIGVYGVMFNLETTLKKHLGITIDGVGTSREANGISMVAPLTARQKEVLEEGVDRIYATFTEHVAEGRNMALSDVLAVAEGRVWSGSDALRLGLVDGIGGFKEAISIAIDLADLDDYLIYELSAPPTPLEEFFNSVNSLFTASCGLNYGVQGDDIRKMIEQNLYLYKYNGMQCIMPVNVKLNL